MLKRSFVVTGLMLAVGLALPAQSDSAEICFSLGGFSNQFRLELTAVSATNLVITGRDAVFADRAITGAAYLGVAEPNTLRMGFTSHGTTVAGVTDIHFNAKLSLVSPFPGEYTGWRDGFGDQISGTFDVISCAGVPAPRGELPDVAQ